MSDHTAIAGVTSTLKTLLRDYMRERAIPNFAVTSATPGDTDRGDGNPGVNLFLYRVTENASLKNQDLSGGGHPAAYGHPPLSLDLHFLVTAYGSTETDDEGAHRLLGDAMLVLHDFAVITEELRRAPPLHAQPVLDESLRGERERVKVMLEPVDLEDLTNLWTAATEPYRASAAYRVSVVQIESERTRPVVRLVEEPPPAGPRVRAVPLDRPRIESVAVRRAGTEFSIAYARIGDTLVIRGSGLAGGGDPGLIVLVGGVAITAPAVTGTTSMLEVPVPNDPDLQPGVHPVEVVRQIDLGDPPVPHAALRSNVAAFVLVPTISTVTPPSGSDPTTITITGERLFLAGADCMVLVGSVGFPLPDPAVAAPPTATQVEVEVTGVAPRPADPYRVAVRVDGAESVVPGSFEVVP